MGKSRITDARLRDAGHQAAGRVVQAMAERLEVTIPDDLLKCEYLGTEEEDAPLIAFKKFVLIACLPMYLERRKSLPFLSKTFAL